MNIYDGNFLEALTNVLYYPSVASKSFLITIGDRSVTGLIARDQIKNDIFANKISSSVI